ncbi:MAG: hypothetical protein ACN6OU_11890 [Stenotrophomonas acidaminiphila]
MATNDQHPDNDDKQAGTIKDVSRAGVALSTSEVVGRYGSANAEHIKYHFGVDNEAGKKLHDGLISVSQKGSGTEQRAGTSAEIIATKRNRAESIINKQKPASERIDDLHRQYGANHPIADRTRINADGTVSYSQTKFEGKPRALVSKIVREDGEYAKYLNPQSVCEKLADKHELNAQKLDGKALRSESRGDMERAAQQRQGAAELRVRAENNRRIASTKIELELPSEQALEIKTHCLKRANFNRSNADRLEAQAALQEQRGNPVTAAHLREKASACRAEADRCDQLSDQITDTGVSSEEAKIAATDPTKITRTDILKTSHRAGMEGAKYGAIIGGSISLLTNVFAVAQDKKQFDEAATDVLLDTGKGVIVGYATAATGAALKGAMQQSSKEALRTLSKTNAATLALNVCISLGSSIHRYANNEITEAELLEEVGEKGAGMLSSGMYAALGQLIIPIPFVGAAVGGMIGYTLSSMFYQAALDAGKQADAAKANLARVREIEAAACEEISRQRTALDEFMRNEFPELLQETEQLFAHVDAHGAENVDAFAAAINRYAELLGAQLQFKNQMEFDGFMESDEPLRLI